MYSFPYYEDGKARWGLFLECPEMFSHPESRNKISNFMITELFYSHILNINRGYLHTISFRSILLSVFRYRLIKNGFAGPISFPGLSRNEPLVTYKLSNYKTSRTSATIWEKLNKRTSRLSLSLEEARLIFS